MITEPTGETPRNRSSTSERAAQRTARIGETVGHIRITEKLGAGGMGEVYVGFDQTLRRRVALKAIAEPYRLSEAARTRFIREARMLSQLDHPNICRIYDFIEEEDGEYLVLELIEGRELGSVIAAGLAPRKKLEICRDIAAVLAAAHAEGIVHRDLKPGNVMLTAEGEVKVLDFGLARSEAAGGSTFTVPRATGGTRSASRSTALDTETLATLGSDATAAELVSLRTERGTVVGTPHFMSPEQARGEPVTTASDMYSFGLLVQAIFTGRSPYPEGMSIGETLTRAKRGETLPIGPVDGDLGRLVARLKSPAAASRPTAATALERLEWILQKPKRRIRRLSAAALVVIAALAGVKYAVDLGRERNLAIEARQIAEQRRDQAEELIGFMLGDLRVKLEPVGRLEILDDVGVQAMQYFASVPGEELSDEELLARSKALYQIGDVRMAQGKLAEARQPFEESLALAKSLLEREPGNLQNLFGLGQSHFWVGYVHLQLGDLDAAQREFQEYFRLSKSLADREPGNSEWQLEVAYGHNNLATVLERKGELAEALAHFEASSDIRRALVNQKPADSERRLAWAHSLSVLGQAEREAGLWDQAVESLSTALAAREELLQTDPDHADLKWYVAISHNNIAVLLLARGEVEEALAHLRTDLELSSSLVRQDGTNTRWLRSLGMTEKWMGAALLARNDVAGALSHLERSVGILDGLVARDTNEKDWRESLATARTGLGAARLAQGDVAGGLAEARRALGALRPISGRYADDPVIRNRIGEARILEGRALERLGRESEARDSWLAALDALSSLPNDSPRFLILRSRALMYLDRDVEAGALLTRLEGMGCRDARLMETKRETRLAPVAAGSKARSHGG